MKKIILLFSLAISILASCKSHYKPVLTSSQGINFKVTSLDSALNESKASKKPLFVFAHASWCPTCREMEKTVLNQKLLGDAYNNNLINVAIDIDSSTGKLLQQSYPIRATPTLFFFRSDGTLEKKVEGATTALELIRIEKQLVQN